MDSRKPTTRPRRRGFRSSRPGRYDALSDYCFIQTGLQSAWITFRPCRTVDHSGQAGNPIPSSEAEPDIPIPAVGCNVFRPVARRNLPEAARTSPHSSASGNRLPGQRLRVPLPTKCQSASVRSPKSWAEIAIGARRCKTNCQNSNDNRANESPAMANGSRAIIGKEG